MTPTQEISKWIAEFGNERDALNVALARLSTEYARGRQAGLEEMQDHIDKWAVALSDAKHWSTIENVISNMRRVLAAQPAQEKPGS